MKNTLSLLALFFILLNGCKKDGCNVPFAFNYDPSGTTEENCVYAPLNLTVSFKPVFGETELSQDTSMREELNTSDGRLIQIDHFAIYLTQLTVTVEGETELLGSGSADCVNRTGDAFLLNNTNRSYSTTVVPDATYAIEALTFNVGVDSCRNVGLDPTTQNSGPFQPQVPTMYWGWASGYRFVTIEGYVDASENADGSDMQYFEYHTGLNALLRNVVLETAVTPSSQEGVNMEVVIDFEKVLSGLDFTTDLSTHTMDNMPLAQKITENCTSAFSVKTD